MNRKILFSALLLTLVFFAPLGADAQAPTATNAAATPAVGMLPQVGVSPTPIVVNQAPPPDTSISLGSGIADLLGALAAIFGSTIATFLTKWVMALAKKAGVQATQAMSDRVDQFIENGIHNGANKIGVDLSGKLTVDVKNQIAAEAVKYAQVHGVETIKSLTGVDPSDPKVIEALQARAAKTLNTIGPDAILPLSKPTQVAGSGAAPAATEIPTEGLKL